MKKLTKYQKEFILECFFKRDDVAGWRTIGLNLLEKGECVVAGDSCVFFGGIGNFIKTENAEGYYNCLIYKFDLEVFLSSAWFNENKKHYLEKVDEKRKRTKEILTELEEEIFDINIIY